ncbi:sensor histidine kinase [Pacificispira sp.]|uniref:sensor histidine kinase n=1 Tax=Pacificispira sp. TaxID=2888761 RepID=UPI003B51EC57
MIDTLTTIFDRAGLMPHGVCFAWRPDLVFAHAGADLMITVAYLAIPIALYKLVRARADIQFGWVLYTFAAFILLCGLTHAVNMYVLWEPNYAFQALVKLATAIVSIATAVLVWRILPKLYALPNMSQLLQSNEQLATEAKRHATAKEQLAQRTSELQASNEDLTESNRLLVSEIEQHTVAKDQLAQRTEELQASNEDLTESNRLLVSEIEQHTVAKDQLAQRTEELQASNEDLTESNHRLALEIDERKAVQLRLAAMTQELQRSNEDLESFAYTASHDLRAPLRGIGNLIGWIREDLGDKVDEDAESKFSLMTDRVQRMERMLEDLLQYSRIGRTDMQEAEFQPEQKIREAFDLLNAEQRFELEIPDPLPTLSGTPIAFQQVVANVIGNAIKHHDGETGRIRVYSTRQDAFVRITIADDGPGIPEQYRERVFALFQTLKPRDSVEGSGMGLAIVRRVLDVAGGKVSITGNDHGRGASVHIDWPAPETQASAA